MICSVCRAANFPILLLSIILPFLSSCQEAVGRKTVPATVDAALPAAPDLKQVSDIVLPAGYTRVDGTDTAFARWLRRLPLKADHTVYLYDGRLKGNQSAQYAVLDMPVGRKDLQQCADAVMRFRAEFFYGRKQHSRIWFADNNGKKYICPDGADRSRFERYLEQVYAWCGTLSLEKQLKPVPVFSDIQPGDVLIKGGSPGHAVLVIDMAMNEAGEKVYLLAQSYMPAQSIHILKNPMDAGLSPWYKAGHKRIIETPEWTFQQQQLRRW